MTSHERQPNIAVAIERSRTMRATRRNRRLRLAAIIIVLAVALVGAGTWSIGALTGQDMVEAAVNQVKSLSDLLGQRSPGQRTEGQLTKTKHARTLAKFHPSAKSLPSAHEALEPKFAIANLDTPLNLAPPVPVVGEAPPLLPIPDFTPPSIGTIITSPPVVSPPGESPPVTFPPPTKELVLTPPAVPEPATWATMLLGFALLGWRLRSARPALSPRAL